MIFPTDTSGHRLMQRETNNPTFIDLFSGCGGLSLGLAQAGFRGVFAVEKDSMAFETFCTNFLNGRESIRFAWPEWLACKQTSIAPLLKKHAKQLRALRGQVDVVAGGPPCQGFSYSGKRRRKDPRNGLFKQYLDFVAVVRPKAVILENVPGMGVPHGKLKRGRHAGRGSAGKSYLDRLLAGLAAIGYVGESRLLDPSNFGVPQRRIRLLVIGLRKDIAAQLPGGRAAIFSHVEAARKDQLALYGLAVPVSASQGISDLEIGNRPLQDCLDPASRPGFKVPAYRGPRTRYQRLMRDGAKAGGLDSVRLARHSPSVSRRFGRIIKECSQGVRMSDEARRKFRLKKHRIFPLAANRPAATVTTLPDDVLHYREPRILSVRECARLQSFPDWFVFKGKYTTGGELRRRECPRYTQVGNAVPPLLARALAVGVASILHYAANRPLKRNGQICAKANAEAVT